MIGLIFDISILVIGVIVVMSVLIALLGIIAAIFDI